MSSVDFQIAFVCWVGVWIVYCLVHAYRIFRFFGYRKFPTTRKGLQEFARSETSALSPFTRNGKKLARLYAYGGISIFMLLAMLTSYYESTHPH